MATNEQQVWAALEEQYGAEIADAFDQAIQDLKNAADLQRAIDAIKAGDVSGLLNALHLDEAAYGPMLDSIDGAYQAGGQTQAGMLPAVRDAAGDLLVFRFNVRLPRAEEWLRQHSSGLVTRITADQREAIQVTLQAGMTRGDNPTRTALDIIGRMDKTTRRRVGGIIGLTPQQAQFVQNARQELEGGDFAAYLNRTLRDRTFDRAIAKAVREDQPLDPETIGKAIVGYERKMLKLRGDTIGRTETLTALRTGQHEAFLQAVDGGVDPSTVTRVWSAVGDDRTRDTHMALNGQKAVGLDVPFLSPSGARMLFPGDTSYGAGPAEVVNCRCVVGYKVDFLGALNRRPVGA